MADQDQFAQVDERQLFEAHDRITAMIAEAARLRDIDKDHIRHGIKDGDLRHHHLRVRDARFIMETSELEASRLMLVKNMVRQHIYRRPAFLQDEG